MYVCMYVHTYVRTYVHIVEVKIIDLTTLTTGNRIIAFFMINKVDSVD